MQRRTAVRGRIALERSVDCAGTQVALQQRNLLQRRRCLSVGALAQPACTRLSALPRRSCEFLHRSFESRRRTIGPGRWMECGSSHFATPAAERQEEQAVALICACCAAVLPSGPRSDIGYLSVQEIFETLTPESFQQNWDLKQYRTSYGSHAAVQRQLQGAE